MRAIVLMSVLTIAATTVLARPGGGGRGKPPFVTACESLSEGDSCSFQGRNGDTIEGTCTQKAHPRTGENELVCWNENMKNMGPPPGGGGRRSN